MKHGFPPCCSGAGTACQGQEGGCQAWPEHGYCPAGLWGRCPHPHIPGARSELFCSHHLSKAVLSPHAASLEWLRVTRAQGTCGLTTAAPRPENRSQAKNKGIGVVLRACHHSWPAPPEVLPH